MPDFVIRLGEGPSAQSTPVVEPEWLLACEQHGCWVDPSEFVVTDK
jgi:hypothetical protein